MASKDVLVCGTLNVETTLPVEAFPLAYEPVRYRRFELRSQPSGVGFNVARARFKVVVYYAFNFDLYWLVLTDR